MVMARGNSTSPHLEAMGTVIAVTASLHTTAENSYVTFQNFDFLNACIFGKTMPNYILWPLKNAFLQSGSQEICCQS